MARLYRFLFNGRDVARYVSTSFYTISAPTRPKIA